MDKLCCKKIVIEVLVTTTELSNTLLKFWEKNYNMLAHHITHNLVGHFTSNTLWELIRQNIKRQFH